MTFSWIQWDVENYDSNISLYRSSTPIRTHAESETLGTLEAVKQVKSDKSKGYLDFKVSFGGIPVKKLSLLDSGNSTKLWFIIFRKLARQLQLIVDKSKVRLVGSACEGHHLKKLGQLPDLELEKD